MNKLSLSDSFAFAVMFVDVPERHRDASKRGLGTGRRERKEGTG